MINTSAISQLLIVEVSNSIQMHSQHILTTIQEKKAELLTLKEKTELQNKKIKLFRKENEELKSLHARQSQIDIDLLLASKELLEYNARLQLLLQETQKDIKKGIQMGIGQTGVIEAMPKNPVLIRTTEVNEGTKEVDLVGVQLQDDQLLLLRPFCNLRVLILADNHLTDESVRMICKHFPKVQKLQLNNNRITGDGLLNIKELTKLQALELRNNNLGEDWLPAIQHLTALQELSLSKNRIGNRGVSNLVPLINLKYLDITNNDIGDEGADKLALLKKLTSLYLMSNKISLRGAEVLFKGLSAIEVLDLRFNLLDQQGKDYLKTILPETIVQMFL